MPSQFCKEQARASLAGKAKSIVQNNVQRKEVHSDFTNFTDVLIRVIGAIRGHKSRRCVAGQRHREEPALLRADSLRVEEAHWLEPDSVAAFVGVLPLAGVGAADRNALVV